MSIQDQLTSLQLSTLRSQMSEEPYAPDLEEFLDKENIRQIHYKIEGNKVCESIDGRSSDARGINTEAETKILFK